MMLFNGKEIRKKKLENAKFKYEEQRVLFKMNEVWSQVFDTKDNKHWHKMNMMLAIILFFLDEDELLEAKKDAERWLDFLVSLNER